MSIYSIQIEESIKKKFKWENLINLNGQISGGKPIWSIQYDRLGTSSMTSLRWANKVKCHNMNVLKLKWLLNSAIDLDRSFSFASPVGYACFQGFIEYYTKG